MIDGIAADCGECLESARWLPLRAGWVAALRRLGAGVLTAALSTAPPERARAGGPDDGAPPDEPPSSIAPAPRGFRSPLSKTLGGRQFWADVELFHDWRIQQHVLTGHFRLLDGDNYRHASGTREECSRRLDEVRATRPAMSGEAVILVHGMVRSSRSMAQLQRRLDREGYTTFRFGYPSTRIDISQAAEHLASVLDGLHGIERIHFVAHSMGGLVIRSCLGQREDARLGRIVMIATPNQGAHLADRFGDYALYRAVLGSAGQQLGRDPTGFIASLPIPQVEFGVIAGGRGSEAGYNPLIPGDDDGTVSVESTRLEGAADFLVVDRLHTFLISDPEVGECAARFLRAGRFRNADEPPPNEGAEEMTKSE